MIILADDVGYGDLSCYGATQVRTPNVDRLAAGGMRYTDGHSPSAMCTATRYALLTGQYAWRHTAGATILSGTAPLCIPIDRLTLPQLFKRAGYATGVVGKWHLGLGAGGPTDYNAAITPGPREVGFDTSFIIPATGDRVPCVYVENGRVFGHDPKDPIRVSYREKVGSDPTGKENPDQLKVKLTPGRGHNGTIVNGISRIAWMAGGTVARWKDEVMADVLTAKATGFIAAHKAEPFFLYFATHDIHAPRVPHPRFRGTSPSPHGTRGDAIHQLDWCVGDVMAALDRHGLTDDTLVLFSSDNGGGLIDGYADGATEDTSGHRPNGRLRGKKGEVWEGGHRVPFIARWPSKVLAGKVSNELVCLMDLMATAAALTGGPLPTAAAPDSLDLSPALFAERPARPAREELVMHSGGAWLAVRKGRLVLVPPRVGAQKGKAGRPQLFDLAADPGQLTDMAAKQPDTVTELTALLERRKGAGGTRPDGHRNDRGRVSFITAIRRKTTLTPGELHCLRRPVCLVARVCSTRSEWRRSPSRLGTPATCYWTPPARVGHLGLRVDHFVGYDLPTTVLLLPLVAATLHLRFTSQCSGSPVPVRGDLLSHTEKVIRAAARRADPAVPPLVHPRPLRFREAFYGTANACGRAGGGTAPPAKP